MIAEQRKVDRNLKAAGQPPHTKKQKIGRYEKMRIQLAAQKAPEAQEEQEEQAEDEE